MAVIDGFTINDTDYDLRDTSKVAVQQGSGNAGKALVVGADGNVTTGDAGIPDAVKVSLLNLVRHVAYTDDQGQAYYDALYVALNGGDVPPEPDYYYKLAAPRRFTGQSGDYIDTGVKLLDGDKDFTIVFDADEVNHDYTENDVYSIYGFAGVNNTGFMQRARYAYGALYYTLGYGANANPSNKYQSSVELLNYSSPSQSNNHIRGVISHAAGSDTCIVALKANDTYASTGGYDGTYPYVPYDGGNLIIGARQNLYATEPIEFFDGVVNEFTIYNYAMSADEVTAYMNK